MIINHCAPLEMGLNEINRRRNDKHLSKKIHISPKICQELNYLTFHVYFIEINIILVQPQLNVRIIRTKQSFLQT